MNFNEVYELMRRNPAKQYTAKQICVELRKSDGSVRRMLNSLYKFKLVDRIQETRRWSYRWVIRE